MSMRDFMLKGFYICFPGKTRIKNHDLTAALSFMTKPFALVGQRVEDNFSHLRGFLHFGNAFDNVLNAVISKFAAGIQQDAQIRIIIYFLSKTRSFMVGAITVGRLASTIKIINRNFQLSSNFHKNL